jgi:hypothetical protein
MYLPPLFYEAPDERRNLIRSHIESKVAAVDNVYLSIWHVPTIGLRLDGSNEASYQRPDSGMIHCGAGFSCHCPTHPFEFHGWNCVGLLLQFCVGKW